MAPLQGILLSITSYFPSNKRKNPAPLLALIENQLATFTRLCFVVD